MANASDIMTRDPMTVASTTEPEEVLKLFLEKRLTAMPVVNPTGIVLGMLTELILARVVIQNRTQGKKSDKIGSSLSILIPPSFVSKDASLVEVVKAMALSPTQRVLVQDPTGKLVGAISPKDILNLLGEVKPAAAAAAAATPTV